MGHEVGNALTGGQHKFWGVSGVPPFLYAADMLNGIYKLDISGVRR